MNILLRIAATILLVLVGAPVLMRLYGILQDDRCNYEDLPTGVRYAALLEFMFGYLVILLSLGFSLVFLKNGGVHWILLVFGPAIGALWVKMAVLLRRGNPLARRVCLLLSAVRVATIFGVVFSIPSIVLLAGKEARKYFVDQRGRISPIDA